LAAKHETWADQKYSFPKKVKSGIEELLYSSLEDGMNGSREDSAEASVPRPLGQQFVGGSLDYRVVVRQNPIQARMAGLLLSAPKRILEPPLILQLEFPFRDPAEPFSQAEISYVETNVVCLITLVFSPTNQEGEGQLVCANTVDGTHQRPWKDDDTLSCRDTLTGRRNCSPIYLRDMEKTKETFFFVYSDLSIRIAGTFHLQITCVDVKTYEAFPPHRFNTNPF